jgi:hypothetical protein
LGDNYGEGALGICGIGTGMQFGHKCAKSG